MKLKSKNNRERFLRLAEQRTNKILSLLKTLGDCSNKSMYDYQDIEIDKIFEAINNELIRQENRFKKLEFKEFKL